MAPEEIEVSFEKEGTLDSGLPIEEITSQAPSLSQERLEKERLLTEALETYDAQFFKQFSFSGKDSLKLS